MFAELLVIGWVEKIREIDAETVCVEIRVEPGESESSRGNSGLTKPVQYSIVVTRVLMQKLINTLPKQNRELLDVRVCARGYLNPDLSYELVEGDFGVVCTNIVHMNQRKGPPKAWISLLFWSRQNSRQIRRAKRRFNAQLNICVNMGK